MYRVLRIATYATVDLDITFERDTIPTETREREARQAYARRILNTFDRLFFDGSVADAASPGMSRLVQRRRRLKNLVLARSQGGAAGGRHPRAAHRFLVVMA